MKRVYLCLISIFFVVPLISLLFNSVSYAAWDNLEVQAALRAKYTNYPNALFNMNAQNALETYCANYPNYQVLTTVQGNYFNVYLDDNPSWNNVYWKCNDAYRFSGDMSSSTVYTFNSDLYQYRDNIKHFNNVEDFLDYFELNDSIDFDTIYYSPNIPLPEMDVYYVLSSIAGGSKVAMWNAEMTIDDNSDFYIQYGYKITVPGLVGIGLDSSTGKYDYSYESYSEGTYVDYVSLEDLKSCINISFGSNEMSSGWQAAYDNMYDLLPDFYAKIPFWVQNPNAAKYVEAQEYYKDFMMTQLPMFGNRLELFARFFTINEDNQVIVGDWLHWSSRTGSRTQEKPSNYIDNVELPGYINSSNNVTLESEENTYQQSGESVGAATIINNNYAPNYPDYPTIASYNKDNLLLDTMGYMSNMNNFLSGPNGFGHFLTEVFTFIPAYVWGMVAMGFGVAIIVMFIKML